MDRWLIWPGLAALLAVLALQFIGDLPGPLSYEIGLAILFADLLVTIAVLTLAGTLWLRGRLRDGASLALVVVLPALFWWPLNWGAQCLHVALTVATGAGRLASTANAPATGFTVYDWSTGLAGGPVRVLIEDDTGQIALPVARQTRHAPEGPIGDACAGRVQHLIGPYYVCQP